MFDLDKLSSLINISREDIKTSQEIDDNIKYSRIEYKDKYTADWAVIVLKTNLITGEERFLIDAKEQWSETRQVQQFDRIELIKEYITESETEEEIGEKFINLTPHKIVVKNMELEPSGVVARVSSSIEDVDSLFCRVVYGEIENLPSPKEGVFYVVSSMVFDRTDRLDVVAPATGHKNVVRNDKGHIISVPCFVTK